MKNRIVQIAVASEGTNTDQTLYALTEDGRLFMLRNPDYEDAADKWDELTPPELAE